MFKSREIGIYEASDKLLGTKMSEFSTKVQFVNTDLKSKRIQALKPVKELKKLPKNDTNIFEKNSIDFYYPNRPENFELMSLHEFEANYEYLTKKCPESHKNCHTLNNNLGFMHFRSEPKVIQTRYIKCSNLENIEIFFHQAVILFLPWRDEDELLCGQVTYHEAFNFCIERNLLDMERLKRFFHNTIV